MKNSDFQRLYDAMMKRVENKQLANFIFGVSVNGKEVCKYEYNDNEKTIYRIASMTKPITAACALIAEEKGLLAITDKVSKYLPKFRQMKVGKVMDGNVVFDKDAVHEMRIIDILTHSSGLGSGSCGDIQLNNRKNPHTLKEVIEEYENWYLDFDPSTAQAYSGVCALDIVAYIIELTSGMPYFSFLKENLLDKLNMTDTTYKLDESQLKRLATMYNKNSETGIIEIQPLKTNSGFGDLYEGFTCGAAGLFSTYHDYMNFAVMLANYGTFNGKRVLSKESVIKMGTGQLSLSLEGINVYFNWGLGVYVRGKHDEYQPLTLGSFGWSGAYSTHFFSNPVENYCAVFMCNINNDAGSGSPNIATFEKAFGDCFNTLNR